MYKIKSLLLMLIALLCSVPMSANIVITMSDGYGDGWNGAGIVVKKGGAELVTITLESGSSSTHSLEYDSNYEYTFYWVKGEHDRECSFNISVDGANVFSATTAECNNYSNEQLLYTVTPKKLVIKMWDSANDAWHGNYIAIKKDGVQIGKATISSGKQAIARFEYDPNSEYTFYWYGTTYRGECSFDILIDGKALFQATRTDCSSYTSGLFLCSSKEEVANFTINMTDAFGDGWTGNSIIVKKDGIEIGNATIENGSTSTAEFEYNPESEYTFYWALGEHSRECSFNITLNGTTIYEASMSECAAFTNGQLIFTKAAAQLYIKMNDTQRNGWSNNAIVIKKDGVQIGSATIQSGGLWYHEIEYTPSSEYTFYWKRGSNYKQCSFDIIVDGCSIFSATTSDCNSFSNNKLLYTFTSSVEIVDGSETTYNISTNKNVHELNYTRTLPNTEWNALYLPFKVPVEILLDNYDVAYFNNMHAYDRDHNGDIDEMDMEVMLLTEGTLHANHPYFIRAKSEDAKELNIELTNATLYATEENSLTCSSVYLNFELKGIYSQRTASQLADCYAINTNGEWSPIASDAYLNPFRLYLKMTNRDGSPVEVEASAMQSIRIRLKDEYTTDIDEVTTNTNESPVIYDLSGRRVDNPGKGVYIVNGKKVIFK